MTQQFLNCADVHAIPEPLRRAVMSEVVEPFNPIQLGGSRGLLDVTLEFRMGSCFVRCCLESALFIALASSVRTSPRLAL